MPTVKDAFSEANKHSAKVSDLVRQMALAGIAVVWVFKKDVDGSPSIEPTLVEATFAFTIGLAFDVSQYLWLAMAAWVRAKRRESDLKLELVPFEERKDKPVHNPPWIPNVGWAFWWLKVLSILVGWAMLIGHLLEAIRH